MRSPLLLGLLNQVYDVGALCAWSLLSVVERRLAQVVFSERMEALVEAFTDDVDVSTLDCEVERSDTTPCPGLCERAAFLMSQQQLQVLDIAPFTAVMQHCESCFVDSLNIWLLLEDQLKTVWLARGCAKHQGSHF